MLELDSRGWCPQAVCLPSPNFDSRPPGMPVELIVIHYISLPPGEYGGSYIADFFLNRLDGDAHPYFDALRGLRVSSHFLVRRDGRLFQFVSTADRAWHAGVSRFRGRERCNDFSIGIELEGCDREAFTAAQYDTLAALTALLASHYPVSAVTGHQHVAPERKTDPGPFFDWMRYEKAVSALMDAAPVFCLSPYGE